MRMATLGAVDEEQEFNKNEASTETMSQARLIVYPSDMLDITPEENIAPQGRDMQESELSESLSLATDIVGAHMDKLSEFMRVST